MNIFNKTLKKKIATALGNRMKEGRLRKGETVDAVAKKFGMSKSMLSQVENAQNMMNVALAYRFMQYYRIDPREVFGGDFAVLKKCSNCGGTGKVRSR